MRLFDDDDDDLDDGHISMLWWPLLSDKERNENYIASSNRFTRNTDAVPR